MKRDISIEMTSKYISLTSNFIGRLRFANPNQSITYLKLDVSLYTLGKEIQKKLAESKEVSEDEFMFYWDNRNEQLTINELEEKKLLIVISIKIKKNYIKILFF